MNMLVETFEIEDAKSEASAMATDAAALELIEKLGLAGQRSLCNSVTVTRAQFRAMEREEALVWRTLCDQTHSLETYSDEAIPLRVLEVAARAKESGMFLRLEVWAPSVARIDDPLLVGVTEQLDPRYRDAPWMKIVRFYLLARWGRSLGKYEDLKKQAIDMLRDRRATALAKAKVQVDAALASLKTASIEDLSHDITVSGI
jgi:nitrogen fixation-related uncharacterized protein